MFVKRYFAVFCFSVSVFSVVVASGARLQVFLAFSLCLRLSSLCGIQAGAAILMCFWLLYL